MNSCAPTAEPEYSAAGASFPFLAQSLCFYAYSASAASPRAQSIM
jgi:hypothetical protein